MRKAPKEIKMKKQEYDNEWMNRKIAIESMRKHFSCFNTFFRWVDTSGTNWVGYDGYIAAYKYTGKKDEWNQDEYKEIGRIVSSSPYLEDGTNLIGGKGCVAMCSFKKQDVTDFIEKLSA
jgi:hypothetical protein